MKQLTRMLAAWCLSLMLFTAARADVLPAGIYTIGEDFPAGSCTISLSGDDDFVSVYLWGSAVDDHETNGGLIYRSRLKPGESLGKIPLNEGNILAVRFGSIDLQPYTGLELDWEQTNLLLRGIYRIGEDIPAGAYQFACADSTVSQVILWKEEVNCREDRGDLFSAALRPGRNDRIRNLALEEGNVLVIGNSPVLIAPFRGSDSEEIATPEPTPTPGPTPEPTPEPSL